MDKKIDNLYRNDKTDEAIHQLIKKIDENPKNVDNYLQLSTYLIEQGSFDQAQKLLEQAQHLVEKPQELSYNLAVAYYMQGEFDKALTLLDKIPNDDLTLYQKALVYLKLGQLQKALAYALSIKNKDTRVKELLGDIWMGLGDFKQAEDNYRQIPEDERSAKINFLLGIVLFDHDKEEAEKFLAKSKKMDRKYYQQAENQYAAIMKMLSDKEKGK